MIIFINDYITPFFLKMESSCFKQNLEALFFEKHLVI